MTAEWIAQRREIEQAATEPLPGDARMDAYYYGFEWTNCGPVDAILSAVATAGKRLHLTEDWQDERNGSESCESMIQRVADESAAKITAALASLPRALDALEAVLAIIRDGDHADTCAVELSPSAGYPCSCWKADAEQAISEALGAQP